MKGSIKMTEFFFEWLKKGDLISKLTITSFALMTLLLTGKENINLIYNELIQLPILENLLSVSFIKWYYSFANSLFIMNLTNVLVLIQEMKLQKEKDNMLDLLRSKFEEFINAVYGCIIFLLVMAIMTALEIAGFSTKASWYILIICLMFAIPYIVFGVRKIYLVFQNKKKISAIN